MVKEVNQFNRFIYIFAFAISLSLLGSVSAAYDPNDFVTTWKTDTTSENPTSITLNFRPFGATGYYEVSWKCNGTYMVVYDHNYTHNYGTAGTYNVCIRSLAPLAFHHGPLTLDDRSKLLEVKQWGGIRWSSFSEAFRGAINLQITATDVPNLSQVTNMSSAFNGAVRLVGNDSMSNWDTSSVTDMNSIGAIQFSIEGNISDYIRISQSNFSDLPPNSSVNITIEILSPELIGVGTQEIRVILTGEKNNAPYIETRTLAIEVSDLPTKPGKTRFKNIIFWILGIIVSIFVLYKLISFILVRSNYLNRS